MERAITESEVSGVTLAREPENAATLVLALCSMKRIYTMQKTNRLTHNDTGEQEDFPIPTRKPCERCIDEDSAKGCGQTRTDSLQTNLHWIWRKDVVEQDWEELQAKSVSKSVGLPGGCCTYVEHSVEVHARDLAAVSPSMLVELRVKSKDLRKQLRKPSQQSVGPGMKVSQRASAIDDRHTANISCGIIGALQYFHSHITNATSRSNPIIIVHSTYALAHGWLYPPACIATRNSVNPTMLRKPPR
jgi:hypothetical protein